MVLDGTWVHDGSCFGFWRWCFERKQRLCFLHTPFSEHQHPSGAFWVSLYVAVSVLMRLINLLYSAVSVGASVGRGAFVRLTGMLILTVRSRASGGVFKCKSVFGADTHASLWRTMCQWEIPSMVIEQILHADVME